MKVTIYKRGSAWWAQWRQDGVRQRRSLRTGNKKIAERMRIELEYRLLHGKEEQPARSERVLVQQLVDDYEAWSVTQKKPKTVRNDQSRIAAFRAFAGPKFVDEITTKVVMDYQTHRADRSPATRLREREILHAMMMYAMRVGYVDRNPVSDVPRPRLPDREPRFLSLAGIDDLMKALGDDRIVPLIAVAIYAGLRREELCWLTWADLVDVGDRQMIRVRAKTVGQESWLPKTKKNRTVPISTTLAAVLVGHGRTESPWLFSSPAGKRWNPDNLSARFRKMTREAGLSWSFLDLRHTFGSQLAKKGLSDIKIAQLMGNSPEIARRHYINLMPEEMMADVEF